MTKLRKAVFPVAGFGTRFLPATKAMPKELLPIVDKPLIQYAAEEAIAAGIDTLIFVTGRNKRAIEDHFDNNQELELALRSQRQRITSRYGQEHPACGCGMHLCAPAGATWVLVMPCSVPNVQ